MSVKQLNIFVENRRGAIAGIAGILRENGIDMRAMVLADSPDYGILRVIVSDAERAVQALNDSGVVASVIKITVIRLVNVRGALSSVLDLLAQNGVNIEYLYAFVAVNGREAYAAVRFDNRDKDRALSVLQANGIPLLSESEI